MSKHMLIFRGKDCLEVLEQLAPAGVHALSLLAVARPVVWLQLSSRLLTL